VYNVHNIIKTMSKMIGYMVTWTTYGSWLQGDNRGYVKHGKIMPGNQQILLASRRQQRTETIKLNPEQRAIVHQAILDEAKRIGQTIDALAVCEHHVHIVARPCQESIPQIVSRYKNVAMFALCKNAEVNRIWTRGFDKRFCFTEEDLKHRIDYVNKHPSY
jgi:REP element-mobilizing transposase RayT